MFSNIGKELFRNNHMSLCKLADLAGIKRATFYDKVHGRSEFTLAEMEAIRTVLKSKMTLDELFERA